MRSEYEGREKLEGTPALPRLGWGHSTIESCVSSAIAAGVRELHLGHRDPARSDEGIARLEIMRKYARRARRTFRGQLPRGIVHEGLIVKC